MPESAPAETAAPSEEFGALLDGIDGAVERLLGALGEIQSRAASAEDAHEKLSEALRQGDRIPVGADVEERLQALADENQKLRDVIAESRSRAERIRSRLQVVEDEL